jgi:hypothetical protein
MAVGIAAASVCGILDGKVIRHIVFGPRLSAVLFLVLLAGPVTWWFVVGSYRRVVRTHRDKRIIPSFAIAFCVCFVVGATLMK